MNLYINGQSKICFIVLFAVWTLLNACATTPVTWYKKMGFNSYEEMTSTSSVPRLIEFLDKSNSEVRTNAAYALGLIGPEAINAIPALVKTLEDSDPKMRVEVTYALGEIGPESAEVVLALAKALEDNDPSVQESAARALGKLGIKAKPAIPSLIGTLDDGPRNTKIEVVSALGKIGSESQSKEIMVALIKLLNEGSQYLRESSAKAIGRMGPVAKTAVPYLVKALNDSEFAVRAEAAEALAAIGPEAATAVPALIETLDDDYIMVQREAIAALGEIGPEARGAIPGLLRLSGDLFMAVFTNPAIDQILPDSGQKVQAMIQALGHSDWQVRKQAAKFIKRIGPEAKIAVPTLIKSFGDDDPQVRHQAVETVLKLESDKKILAPAFVGLLSDPEFDLRKKAILFLQKTNYVDVDYINALQKIAKSDPDESARKLASESLRNVQFSKVLALKPPEPQTSPVSKAVVKPTAPPVQKDFGKKWAVVIGISIYQDTRVPPLRYAARDAEAFYQWLVSSNGGQYSPVNVKLLLDQNGSFKNIRDALYIWLSQALEEDQVTIYIAGHGSSDSPDSTLNLFFLPYDVQYDRIAATGMPMWDIETALKRYIRAERVVIIADACHSGGVGKSFDIARRANRGIKVNSISKGFQNLSSVGKGVCVISASDEKQFSQESREWGGGHGVFTYFLLKGLNGEADYSEDGKVTLGEIIPYLSEQVRRATRGSQSPTVAGKFDPALSIGR